MEDAMKSLLLALALLAVPAAALAQDAPPKGPPGPVTGKVVNLLGNEGTLDERFYRAFYQENGLRDFDKAADLYAEVADAAAKAGNKEMQVKSLLGRGRCLKVAGKKDETRKALQAVLALEPANQEAAGLLASLEGKPGPGEQDEELADRCNSLLQALASNSDYLQACRELALLGDRTLPFLEKALGFRYLSSVEGAARLLATGAIPGGREALLHALADPGVVYSRAICEVVLNAWQLDGQSRDPVADDLPLLEAVARRPEPELRSRVVVRLASADLGGDPRALGILKALSGDAAQEVRLAVISTDWFASYWKEIAPVVTAALRSPSPAERAAAAGSVKQDRDLLRRVAGDVRGLLRDEDATVRGAAFSTLAEVDGLGQGDLASLLADADGNLVKAAADRLREVSPWEKGTGDAVRAALRKALRAEIPGAGIAVVLGLATSDARVGGITPEDLVELFTLAWAPEQRLGSRAASEFRTSILDQLAARRTVGASTGRWILHGVESIGSADGVLQWLAYWEENQAYFPPEPGFAAASSDDARVRAAGYRSIVFSGWTSAGEKQPAKTLRRLSEDLLSEDADLSAAALSVASVFPDPASVDSIRRRHSGAEGETRAWLLQALVKAAGKGAEPEVRADLASKDPTVRSRALAALVLDLGVQDGAEIRKYLESGGQPREVAALWLQNSKPPVALLSGFLRDLGTEKIDDLALRAAACLPEEERLQILKGCLLNTNPAMRCFAASLVANWRAVDLSGQLAAMLDDPDTNVQAAAAQALEDLRKYLERKATAARLREGGEANTRFQAELMLHDADPLKRRGAVLALAALGDRAAIGVLLRALDDQDKGVRDAAIGALERLGGKPATEPKPDSK
jgi:HEAT repeat protein